MRRICLSCSTLPLSLLFLPRAAASTSIELDDWWIPSRPGQEVLDCQSMLLVQPSGRMLLSIPESPAQYFMVSLKQPVNTMSGTVTITSTTADCEVFRFRLTHRTSGLLDGRDEDKAYIIYRVFQEKGQAATIRGIYLYPDRSSPNTPEHIRSGPSYRFAPLELDEISRESSSSDISEVVISAEYLHELPKFALSFSM